MPKDLLAAKAPRDLLADKSSYPGEGVVRAAVGPAYGPAKALVKGYMGLRGGVQDKIREFIPEGEVPVPQFAHEPFGYMMRPLDAFNLSKEKSDDIAAEFGGQAMDALALFGLGKGASAVNEAGLTRMGAAEARNPGALDRLTAMREAAKQRKNISRLLPDANISKDIELGRPVGVQVEGAKVGITKTNNPVNIRDKFALEKQRVVSDIDARVGENNTPVSPKYIFNRVKLLLKDTIANSNPAERKKLGLAIRDELNWMKEQGEFDTAKAHGRKKYLYEETKRLQRKQAQGRSTITEPERDLVKDKFAQAYREVVEKTHPDIAMLNQRWAGLDSGQEAASKLAESMIEQGSPLERMATQVIGRPSPQGVAAAAVRELPMMKRSVSHLTGLIEKQGKRAAEALSRSRMKQAPRLIDRFLEPNREYFKQLVGPDDIEALVSPNRPALPTSGAFAGEGFETLGKEASAKAKLRSFIDPTTLKSEAKSPELTYSEEKPSIVSAGRSKKALAAAAGAGGLSAAGQAQASDKTLGVRNNNPFNVKGADKWLGSTGKDKQGHRQFESIDHGIRAGVKNLEKHKAKNPEQTLAEYMNNYAEENGTNEAKFIAKKLGISPNEKLKNIDMRQAAIAVAKFESKYDLTIDDINRAMSITKPKNTKKIAGRK